MKKTIVKICITIITILWLLVIAGILHKVFASETVVNVNTANQEELIWLKGIGKVKAKRIISSRPFTHIDSLINVKGIGLKTLVNIYAFVTVEDSIETHIHNPEE